MAYCRLGHIKENRGAGGISKGLKNCLNYIFNPQKTESNKYVGAYNYILDSSNPVTSSYTTMIDTKEIFGKIDGRQAYHYKLSFATQDNVSPELALEITNVFCNRVFTNYECAYSVHTNTKHIHSHIVFNSVNMLDGYKYYYKKGDWANTIQPVANEICKEYNLSELDLNLDEEMRLKNKCKKYSKWVQTNGQKTIRNNEIYTNARIKEDIDYCIKKATTYDEFLDLMTNNKKMVVNTSGKYITVLAPGRQKACRIVNLTPDKSTYTKENIERMINGCYMSKDELCAKLFDDWEKYMKNPNITIKIAKLSKDMAIYYENKLFQKKNNLWKNEDILNYKEYLDRADRELNVIKKYVKKSMDARSEILEKFHFIIQNIETYESADTNSGINEKIKEYYKEIKMAGYNLIDLYNYQNSGENLLKEIEKYKKHIFVEKKICSRLEAENKKISNNKNNSNNR